jgi:hypothetical protein
VVCTAVPGPIPNSIWSSTASSKVSGAAEIATIAIMPAGLPADSNSSAAAAKHAGAARSLALALKETLQAYGPVLQLNSSNMRSRFPGALGRLHVLFYRSKVTSWMVGLGLGWGRWLVCWHITIWDRVAGVQAGGERRARRRYRLVQSGCGQLPIMRLRRAAKQ